ncbi:hypothetical protein N7462_008102 [Penicillium macrosclerotiorum]|uniref:uncharacterized protein n=1 Tax=Penicillium macrosclerotiorum TaxID=303699 RepID=UPI002546B925|nr:uncharacterized protein N7462_008102 [Penicillium macrosclerotiorum]KAJ5679858.1 hypothetical protein N7462_008102 [Penicillium macrosclerotiorum]
MLSLGRDGLRALAFAQLAQGFAFQAAEPTAIQHYGEILTGGEPQAPETTPGLSIKDLQRRYATTTSGYEYVASGYVTADASVCGWVNADTGTKIICQDSSSCVFHTTATGANPFPGMVGCCLDGDCSFETVCYDSSKISATPSLTGLDDPFAILCTQSDYPSCVTYSYSDLGIVDYQCAYTSDYTTMYAWATANGVTGATEIYTTVAMSTINDAGLSSYSSSYDSKYGTTTKPSATHFAYSGNATQSPTATATNDGSSSSSSTSTGAIAGGVVGGVAGAACIAGAAAFFLIRRRRYQRKQTGLNSMIQGGYQSVPASHSPQGWEMQQPSEMESNEASQKYTEAPGSEGPQHPREIYEMDTGGRDFIAELPASTDYDVKHK